MFNLRRNILIFHQAALGDFVVTFPLALAMGRMFPQSRVMYVTASSKGKLAERLLGVDSVDIETGWHVLHGPKPELNDRNRSLVTGAHTIISFVSSPNDTWEDNVRAFNPQATLVQLTTKPEDDRTQDHIASALVRQLNRWPAISSAAGQMLSSIQNRGLTVKRNPTDVIIHPGAGKPEKCWPVEKFVKLVESLHRHETPVRILLGEAELEKFSPDALAAIEKAATVRKPASYLDLLDEISQATVFVGNDSGPGHIAGAIGVPTVSLFGSPSYRWKPLGPKVHVIEKESLSKISVDEVARATREHTSTPVETATVADDEED
jgi:ADP-heptose:LPS heptosyltransferase